jgi:hypothetical protein
MNTYSESISMSKEYRETHSDGVGDEEHFLGADFVVLLEVPESITRED